MMSAHFGAPAPGTAELGLRLRHGTNADQIQGNILAGFKKDHQAFLCLQLADRDSGQTWLKGLCPRVATTRQVAEFNERFSKARRANGGQDPSDLRALWLNVAFTYEGMCTLSDELEAELGSDRFEAFREGPARRRVHLGDSNSHAWVFGADHLPRVHVLLTIAADTHDDLLLELSRQICDAAQNRIVIVFAELGRNLGGNRHGREHFGFRDAISQPGVRGFDYSDATKRQVRDYPGTDWVYPGEFVLGYRREGPVRVDEQNIDDISPGHGDQEITERLKNGSFQVFLRLKQDVPGFLAQVGALERQARQVDPNIDADLLAAKLIGRWRSGTPLAQTSRGTRDNRSARDPVADNDFTFENDAEGYSTPLFAHIRKMNRRDGSLASRRRRIIRRGIPFGPHFDPALGRGHGVDTDRGLLFSAFLASIEEQYEKLRMEWANSIHYPAQDTGPDPIIGAPVAGPPGSDERGVLTDESTATGAPLGTVLLRGPAFLDRGLRLQQFVHSTGALYLFAPSLRTLNELAGSVG